MDYLSQLIIISTCLLLVVASRYNPQQHEERLHELEKWPFTTTTPSYSYKELTSYPFQPWTPPATSTENPQRVLAQMFKTQEISDMREPPKVNKNPLMFQNYDEEKQPPVTQKPNRTKNMRNNTRTVTTNKRTTFTTTTRPVQTTTQNSRKTTTNSSDSIIFKDNELNTAFTTPPQTTNATNLELNTTTSNDTKANITSDGFGTRLRNHDTKPQEATTETPVLTVNVTALNPAQNIETAVPNQAVVIQAMNPASQAILPNPTLNTANVPQYILGNNQITLSASSAVTQLSNQPTLYTIVTVPNSQQQIIVQSGNAPNSIPQNPTQLEIKNTDPNVNIVQNKEPAAAVSQLASNNQQYILVSSSNQPVSQVQTSSNQLMVIQVPNNQYQVPNNQYQVPNNQYQVPNNQYVPNNRIQVPNNQIQVPNNQLQYPNNQCACPQQATSA